MAKKPKLILLKTNGSFQKTKKSIAQLLLEDGDDIEWVLIPILNTSCTYIAVDWCHILRYPAERIYIKYHLKYGQWMRRDVCDPIIYDYYTTSLTLTSLEELYQLIYTMGAYHYVASLPDDSSWNGSDYYWYIMMSDISIDLCDHDDHSLFNFEYHMDMSLLQDSPFDVLQAEKLCRLLRKNFGLYGTNSNMVMDTLVITEGKNDLKWSFTNGPCELSMDVTHVGVPNPICKSFTLMKARDYDLALQFGMGYLVLIPLCFSEPMEESNLHISEDLALNQFTITKDKFFDEAYGSLYAKYQDAIFEHFSMSVRDGEDSMLVLDNFFYIMQIYYEGIKLIAFLNQDEAKDDTKINGMRDRTSLLLTFVVTVIAATVEGDVNIEVVADVRDDHIPNLKDVCHILRQMAEKS